MALQKTASLRQMTTFQTVARLGSVSLAAEELHLSQSAVSIQIASLESSAGAPLVERTLFLLQARIPTNAASESARGRPASPSNEIIPERR